MSEAMTNREIEDVLASVRRLVAQDRSPRPERLILTEEYRVRQANLPVPPTPVSLSPAPVPPVRPAVAAAVAAVLREAEPVAVAPQPAVREPEADPAPAPETKPEATPESTAVAGARPETPPEPPVDMARLEATISDLEARLPGGPAPKVAAAESPPSAARPPQVMDDDVAFIDEADLERLVSRMVREELRGQLGERITLQVRKLIRAEIAKALEERNLLT